MALRYKRDDEGDMRAELLKSLNIFSIQGALDDRQSIFNIIERIQALMDLYLTLETEYHQFEDQLDHDEFELSKTEQKLSSLLNSFVTSEGHTSERVLGLQEFKALSSTVSDETYYPLLISEYLSRVGDTQILKERLAELDLERSRIAEEQRLRSQFGIALDEESYAFLSTYDNSKSETEAELAETERDVACLYAKCQEEGLLGSDDAINHVTKSPTLDLDDLAFSLQNSDPLRASELDNRSPFFEQNISKEIDTTRFINKWILHGLRQSAMEVKLLILSNKLLY
jgi:hypothetical protein